MPSSEKKDSPFSPIDPSAGKERAFKVVLFLAIASFLTMTGGIYLDFFSVPNAQTVYYLVKQETPKTSLLAPQPPAEKPFQQEDVPPASENPKLMEQLEKERTVIEQTAEALRESIQDTTASVEMKNDPVILPETEELQKLQQEKDLADQKKLEEIEKLHQERMAEENKKIDVPEQTSTDTTAVLPAKERAEEKNEKKVPLPAENAPLKRPEPPFGIPTSAEDAPLPNLIQTNLMGSLPDFSALKKPAQTVVPLHIIDPLPELQSDSRYGRLPVENNGKTPFSAYGKSLETPPASPYIAILFSGLGKRNNATQAAIAVLPDVVSLSFNPYSEKLKTYVSDARKAGHETLLDLPMQQGLFPETDPGPLGLVSGLPEQENRKRLQKVLGKDIAFIGISATPNETFSYSGIQIKPFFDEIHNRGLVYIDGTDNPRMPLFKGAVRPDVHIADNFHRAAITAKLERAKKIALEKGAALLRVETFPITLLTVLEWMKSFVPTDKNPVPEISFVPLSYYVLMQKEEK